MTEYEKSLALYNTFLADVDDHCAEYKDLTIEKKRNLKKNIYKKIMERHADMVWERLNEDRL